MSHPMRVDPAIIADMWNRGEPIAEIAEAFGVTAPAVSKWVRIMGLPSRSVGRPRNERTE